MLEVGGVELEQHGPGGVGEGDSDHLLAQAAGGDDAADDRGGDGGGGRGFAGLGAEDPRCLLQGAADFEEGGAGLGVVR